MGLDLVEIVMDVEDEFRLDLPDAECERCETVGQFADLVHSRLRRSQEERCPSQHGFYIVRKALMKHLGLARAEVRRDTRLEAIFPRKRRRAAWMKVATDLTESRKPPDILVRPRSLKIILNLTVVATAVGTGLAIGWWAGIGAALVLAILAEVLTRGCRVEFPTKLSTVGDSVRLVTTLDSGIWTKEQVLGKIQVIAADNLGLKPEQITPNSHWVKDLGAD